MSVGTAAEWVQEAEADYKLCREVDADFRMIITDLDELNAYGPAFRYPGPNATIQDAQSAIQSIKRVREFVRAKLGLGK